jgi:hypothetical protein
MKTKRILALLLALLILLGSGAAFGVSAAQDPEADTNPADGIKDYISVHAERKIADAPSADFNQPGYWFVWVTGVYPGNVVKWIVKDSLDQDVTAKVGSANAAGFTFKPGVAAHGNYTITVEVTRGAELAVGTPNNLNSGVEDNGKPNVLLLNVPNRQRLSAALNGDTTVNLSMLYVAEKWAAYDKAKTQALQAYDAYYLTQDRIDYYTQQYIDAQNDLPLNDQRLSEFLWHLLNFFYSVMRAIPFGNQPYYTL